MAEECITLVSGCEVEIVEAETCDIEVIVSTDCATGGGGGLPELLLDTTFHVAVLGSDVTGDGTIGNPFATPKKALAHVDGFRIVGDITITILLGAGDFIVDDPLTSFNPRADAIILTAAPLLLFLRGIHYTPIAGPFPGVGFTNDLLVSAQGSGFTDIPTNLAQINDAYATRIILNGDTFSGVEGDLINISNKRFPTIENIAFINAGEDVGNSYIDFIHMEDSAILNINNCATFGFDVIATLKTGSVLNVGLMACAHNSNDTFEIENNSVLNVDTDITIAGPDSNIFDMDSGGQFQGNLDIGGSSNDAIVMDDACIFKIHDNLNVYGIDAEVFDIQASTVISGQSAVNIFECSEAIFAEHCYLNIPFMDISLSTGFTAIELESSFGNFVGLNIADDGGNAKVVAEQGSVIFLDDPLPHITFDPEIGVIDGSGNAIYDMDSARAQSPELDVNRLGNIVIDMGVGTVIDSNVGSYFKRTITGSATFTFTDTKLSNNIITLEVTNGDAGVLTFTGVTWLDGIVDGPVFKASGVDILQFYLTPGGAIYGTTVNNFADIEAFVIDELDLKEDKNQKGIANGYASLDSSTKIPLIQIPDSVLGQVEYRGTWNAATNTPTIPAASSSNKGDYYVVNVAGSTNIDGETDWKIGDWLISNGTTWDKIDNTESVISVAGKTGIVLLDHDTDLANSGINTHTIIDTHLIDASNPHEVTLEQARIQNDTIQGRIDFNNFDVVDVKELIFKNGANLTWNPTDKTVNIPSGLGPVIQVGQEVTGIFHNNTGVTIPDGSVVYLIPGLSINGRACIALAQANTHETLLTTLYITTMNILNNDEGFATKFGKIRNIDTSAWPVGSILWLSPTVPGGFINAPPEFPSYRIGLAGVVVSDPVIGELFVDVNVDLDDTFRNFWNGVTREHFEFLISSDGAIITGSLESSGTSDDLTLIFSSGFALLDTSPPTTIVLTAGTDSVPQINYVYLPISTKVLTINLSSWPAEEHVKIAYVVLRSAVSTQTEGPFVNQNINDALQEDSGLGHLNHITQRIRLEGSVWISGVEASITIDSVPTPDDVFISNTGGIVFQLHEHNFPALDMATGNHLHVVNHPTVPFEDTVNLNTQILDALGVSLNNTSFSFVIWGVINEEMTSSHLMLNLPTGTYAFANPTDAINDPNNKSVYTIPKDYQSVGFLIARFTFTYKNDVWTLEDTEDLRGFKPNVSAGGGVGGVGVTTFLGLTDTPSAYTGQATLYPKVNVGETALEFVDVDTVLAGKQADLENVPIIELGAKGTGDRNALIDFHSSGIPNSIDRSARIIRKLGVDGDFEISNTGNGVINLATKTTLSVLTPTDVNELIRKDYADAKVAKDDTILQTMVGELLLPQLALSAIDNELDATTIDAVYIYDTSLDDDNGAWVEQANWQGWYNETLNTATRGATRKFPKTVLITVSNANKKITFYNGDKHDTPMWLVIDNLNSTRATGGVIYAATSSAFFVKSVVMKNGILYFQNVGLVTLNFRTDANHSGRGTFGDSNHRQSNKSIALRNEASFWHAANPDLAGINSNSANQVHVIANGDMTNTVGISLTTAGISIIYPNERIFDITWATLPEVINFAMTKERLIIDLGDGASYGPLPESDLDLVVWREGFIFNVVTANMPLLNIAKAGGIRLRKNNDILFASTSGFIQTMLDKFSFGMYPSFTTGWYDVNAVGVYLCGAINPELDFSLQKDNLTIVGTMTDSPVLTGSDLDAFSGFSASDYYEQAVLNTNMDFGTGDFYMKAWVEGDTGLAIIEGIGGRTDVTASGGTFYFQILASGEVRFYTGVTGYDTFVDSTVNIRDGLWHFIFVKRENGFLSITIDKIKSALVASTDNVDNASGIFRIGQAVNVSQPMVNSRMTLFALGSGAPSDDDIQVIRESESTMFIENTTTKLEGSGDILGIDYDESTEEVLITSSAGSNRVQGVLVVDSNVTAGTRVALTSGKELIAS